MQDGYGTWDADALAAKVPAATGSGDVHITAYGYSADLGKPTELLVAKGENFPNGSFSMYAYEAPFARWELSGLWGRKL